MDTVERTAAADTATYDAFVSYSHAADDLLAPRLQSGLQRFAKPWWRRRALRVFRDESSLSANPHLWSSITDAMDRSAWFVLLLSPDAARSEWVNQEIEYWLEHKDRHRIIPVVTEGELGWADGDVAGDAVPPELRGVFPDEPRWVDLRFARDDEQLDLKNPRFSAAVADVASAIRGVPKDELESEEVKQHRRTVRTALGGGVALIALLIATALAAIYANSQRTTAVENAATADAEAARADDQAALAREAEQAARAEAFAQASLVAAGQDVDRALLLALAGIDASDTPTTRDALRRALAEHNLIDVVKWSDDRMGIPNVSAVLSPNREMFAVPLHVAGGAGPGPVEIELWRVGANAPEWVKRISEDSNLAVFGTLHFDGADQLLVGAHNNAGGTTGNALYRLSVEDGEVLDVVELDACDGYTVPIRGPDSTITKVVITTALLTEDDTCDPSHVAVSVLDLASGERSPLSPFRPVSFGFGASGTPDGSRVAIGGDEPVTIFEVDTASVVRVLEEADLSEFSGDGSRIAVGRDPVVVRDVVTGELLAVMQSGGKELFFIRWGPDDETLYGITQQGGEVFIFDSDTGVALHTIRQPSSPRSAELSNDGELLVTGGADGESAVRFWRVPSGVEGELPPIATGGPVDALNAIAGTQGLSVVDDLLHAPFSGSAGQFSAPAEYRLLDLDDGVPIRSAPSWASALSPDGVLIVEQPVLEDEAVTPSGVEGASLVGPPRIVDALTGNVHVELEGCSWYSVPGDVAPEPAEGCTYEDLDRAAQFIFADGNRLVAASTWDYSVAVWDATDGSLLWRTSPAAPGWQPDNPLAVSPDGEMLAWLGNENVAPVVDARTGDDVATPDGWPTNSWSMVFDEQATRLYVGRSETVVVYDSQDWTSEEFDTDHGNSIRQIRLDEENGRLFTVGTDSAVRVWDLATFEKIDEMHVAGTLENGLFSSALLDSSTLAVAGGVFGDEKQLLLFALDPNDLIDQAVTRLTRGFTDSECATYGIDPCPTHAEITSR